MALSVRFHPAGRAQLFDLYKYIAAETGRDGAGGYIDRIEASCLSLGTFPEKGRKAEILRTSNRQFALIGADAGQ